MCACVAPGHLNHAVGQDNGFALLSVTEKVAGMSGLIVLFRPCKLRHSWSAEE